MKRTSTKRTYTSNVFSPRSLVLAAILLLVTIAILLNFRTNTPKALVPAARIDDYLLYTFNVPGTIEESGSMNESRSPYWWLDSGGRVTIADDIGQSIQGTLPESDAWYVEYRDTNPEDTDEGARPQNLLRLVSRSSWRDVRVEASFFIARDHFSKSGNRNGSNGLLLMSRYSDDGQTLYYAGIRVDGTAVIKKKHKGTYHTMAQEQIFPGTYAIDKSSDTSQNILPHKEWLRLRSETSTNPDGSVSVKLYMQDPLDTDWKLLLSAEDKSQYDGTSPIKGAGYAGIRTDFMDVKFDDILMEKL